MAKYLLLFPLVAGCEREKRQSPPLLDAAPAFSEKTPAEATQPSGKGGTQLVTRPLPDMSTVQGVHLVEGLNASQREKLTEGSFKQLLSSARPVSSNDPPASEWAYAPWYSGKFTGSTGVYSFELFLGGRGKLQDSEGNIYYFSFDHMRSE